MDRALLRPSFWGVTSLRRSEAHDFQLSCTKKATRSWGNFSSRHVGLYRNAPSYVPYSNTRVVLFTLTKKMSLSSCQLDFACQ